MDVSSGAAVDSVKAPLPETELFLTLLFLIHLYDLKAFDKVRLCVWIMHGKFLIYLFYQGLTLALSAVQSIQSYNRRTLDPIAGRVYFYYAQFHEVLGKSAEIRSYVFLSFVEDT
jgi:26S proteasome regulatory subunit N3